jgi:hypothetical protein
LGVDSSSFLPRADIRTQRLESRKKSERDKSFEDQTSALMPHAARKEGNASGLYR